MSIDKKEPDNFREDSMDINSPTPEAEAEPGAPQETITKRKGGRKPVRYSIAENLALLLLIPAIDICNFGGTQAT